MSLQPIYNLSILYQTETGGSGGWWLFLIGLVALVGFLYWFRQISEEDLEERAYLEENYPVATAMPAGFMLPETAVLPAAHDHHHDHHESHEDHHHEPATEAHEPDDLTKVEGIGPKIASLLQEAGINTYGQLAQSDAEALSAILSAAGPQFQLADPTTWPQQALLLAAGEMEQLAQLQAELKGGRQS